MPDHNGDCEAREREESTVKLCRDCADTTCAFFVLPDYFSGSKRMCPGGKCFKPKTKETQSRACKDCADQVCKFTKSNVVGDFICFVHPKWQEETLEGTVVRLRKALARIGSTEQFTARTLVFNDRTPVGKELRATREFARAALKHQENKK